MPKMFFPAAVITAVFLCLGNVAVSANESTAPSQGASSDSVVDKVEKSAVRAAKATKRGITHAAEATERGIKRGAQAVAKGVNHGREAVSRTASNIAEKVSPSQAPAPVSAPAKAD